MPFSRIALRRRPAAILPPIRGRDFSESPLRFFNSSGGSRYPCAIAAFFLADVAYTVRVRSANNVPGQEILGSLDKPSAKFPAPLAALEQFHDAPSQLFGIPFVHPDEAGSGKCLRLPSSRASSRFALAGLIPCNESFASDWMDEQSSERRRTGDKRPRSSSTQTVDFCLELRVNSDSLARHLRRASGSLSFLPTVEVS
jgi:hypothetical protein